MFVGNLIFPPDNGWKLGFKSFCFLSLSLPPRLYSISSLVDSSDVSCLLAFA